MFQSVLIVGHESLAALALSILQSNQMIAFGVLAEKKGLPFNAIKHVPILGNLEEDDGQCFKLIGQKCAVFVAIQQAIARKRYIQQIGKQLSIDQFINLIHPSTEIDESTKLGGGNFIDTNVMINPHVELANYCFLHKNVILGTGVSIKSFTQIGPGCIIGDGVSIEEDVFIGAGAVILEGLNIGTGARVGIGSVVLNAVKPGEAVLGNPAKIFPY